jgi:hypothetical protein
VLKGLIVAALVVALAAPAGATAARTSRQLMPGVTYVRESGRLYDRRVVLHAVLGPKPGGLYGLRPVLSNNAVRARERVSAMQRRLSRRGTLVGVNGDLFNWALGYPSGIFVRRGILYSQPLGSRSSLGVGRDGLVRVGRLGYAGRWGPADEPLRRRMRFNRPVPGANGFALFVPSWGSRTPTGTKLREAVVTGFMRVRPNQQKTGAVVAQRRGGGHRVPAGGAMLQARGDARAVLRRVAKPGASLSFRLGVDPWWQGVPSALGGGPVLVRSGTAVLAAGEAFSAYQLNTRHPRTAVGQLADGRILLVAVDGRTSASAGLTTAQLARQMVRLGAVEAFALDAGGSTTIAFDGKVLNHPSDGAERPVAESLQLVYSGVYTPPPRYRSFSPNGDGVADVQRLVAKVPRRSTLDVKLVQPNGAVRWSWQGQFGPGRFVKELRRRSLPEGGWRWVARAVDGRGLESSMARKFRLNKTLGFLTLDRSIMRVRPRRGGHLRIGFRLAHRADVSVSIRRRGGALVRRLVSRSDLGAGDYAVVWDGRNRFGRVVRSGTFVVRVRASNGLGLAGLNRRVRVVRIS